MTYHPLGATPEELRARLTTTAPKAATAALQRMMTSVAGAGTWARIPKPNDIVQVPSSCSGIRIASFDTYARHEPPAFIPAKGGLLMFTVQIDPRWLPANMQVRTQQMLGTIRGIQNRMRPTITRWLFPKKSDAWTRTVQPIFARSMVEGSGKIAQPDHDTAWALDWNHSGPTLWKSRHITGINSVPTALFNRWLDQQTDPAAAEALSWLSSVQPGIGGVLPRQGIIWFTVEVLKDPRWRDRHPPSGARGSSLLTRTPMAFEAYGHVRPGYSALIGWSTRIASRELQAHHLGTLAIAIPSWIPGLSIDNLPLQPHPISASSWRDPLVRESWRRNENARLVMSGYKPLAQGRRDSADAAEQLEDSPAIFRKGSAGRPNIAKEANDRMRNAGDVAVVGNDTIGVSAVVNIGVPDKAVLLDYRRAEGRRTVGGMVPAADVNLLYDIASVVASGWVDILVPFFTIQLMGPSTDRALREESNRWIWRTDRWINIQQATTNYQAIVSNALAVGEQARAATATNPAMAMQLVNAAIKTVETFANNLREQAGIFVSGGWATADLDGQVERTAQTATTSIRQGLTVALGKLQKRLTRGATESQRLHATCVLYTKANEEGRTWPAKLRSLLPAYENARSAAASSMPHVATALAAYGAALEQLYFIKSQIPLPWWQRRFGPIPVWGWGAIGVTGFLGGAVTLRRRRKKRLSKMPEVKKNFLVRRTSR